MRPGMNYIGSIWSQHNSTVVNRLDYLGTQQRVCRGLNTILGIPDPIDEDRLAQIGKNLASARDRLQPPLRSSYIACRGRRRNAKSLVVSLVSAQLSGRRHREATSEFGKELLPEREYLIHGLANLQPSPDCS